MDLVYIHKQKRSDEILWSIKSAIRNLHHNNIYVVGDDPGIHGITVIKPNHNWWSTLSKYHDQANKYLAACEHPEISEEFIAMNDDFFILGPWTPQSYNRGSLDKHIASRNPHDAYRRSLADTKQYLETNAKNTLSFELHTPMIFEKSKLMALINSMEMNRNRIYQLRSLYGNIYEVPTTFRNDVKNIPDFTDSGLLSTTERYFIHHPIGQYIRSKLS